MAEVASAYVSLIPSAKGFGTAVTKETDKAAQTAGKRFGGIFSGSLKGVIGGALAGIGVTRLVSDALGEAREAQKVGALTAQVIKTTGGVANVTADEVGNLAAAISDKVAVDDEAIQSGANLLLTFKNVRNEVGKNNAIFDRATKAAVDLSASGFGDMASTAKQLGKALNDPVKGITAMTRSGVTFTEQQKEQIKTLVESGKTLDAQKIILREVESQVGGAAAATATASDRAEVAAGNLKETIGTALIPAADGLANLFTNDIAPAVTEFVTGMQDGTGAGGDFVDVLKDARGVGEGVLDIFNAIPGPVKKYGLQFAIAAAALNKVNNGLVAGRAAFSAWTSSLGPAGAEMTRTRKSLYGLGVGMRNLAGAGGAIALTKSADETSLAMASLQRVGGGLAAGFAVGGPLGAAIGGTGGLLWTLKDAVTGSARSSKIALPAWKEYGQTLDGVAASTTKATREMVLQRLESSGLLEATRKLGLTDRQAVLAMTGHRRERALLAVALREGRNLTIAQRQALEQETGAVGQARLAQLKHNVAIAGSKKELREARTALRNFMAEPASKRVDITGVEGAKAELRDLRNAIRQVWGAANDLNNVGTGGIDVLLNPKKRALGGPVTAGQPYIVGERRPELFVPDVNGRIIPKVPTASVASSVGSATAPAPQFNVEQVVAQDVNDFLRQMQTRARHAALDGIRR